MTKQSPLALLGGAKAIGEMSEDLMAWPIITKEHEDAVLDDYAHLIGALIDLYQADFDAKWLKAALELSAQMIDLFEEVQESIVAIQRVPMDQTSQYGIVEGDKNTHERTYKINNMIEKPTPGTSSSDMAIIGRYLLMPDIFDYLGNATPGYGGEIQLTDGIAALRKSEEVYAYSFEGTRYDCGSKIGYLQATVEFALKHDELADEFRSYLRGLDV